MLPQALLALLPCWPVEPLAPCHLLTRSKSFQKPKLFRIGKQIPRVTASASRVPSLRSAGPSLLLRSQGSLSCRPSGHDPSLPSGAFVGSVIDLPAVSPSTTPERARLLSAAWPRRALLGGPASCAADWGLCCHPLGGTRALQLGVSGNAHTAPASLPLCQDKVAHLQVEALSSAAQTKESSQHCPLAPAESMQQVCGWPSFRGSQAMPTLLACRTLSWEALKTDLL